MTEFAEDPAAADVAAYVELWRALNGPDLVLMRGPAACAPLVASGNDLDVLCRSAEAQRAAEETLRAAGFRSVQTTAAYQQHFARRVAPKRVQTVDLYCGPYFGWGVLGPNVTAHSLPEMTLLRAVFDKRDLAYFTDRYAVADLPPSWQAALPSQIADESPVILGLRLLKRGVVRVDGWMTAASLVGRVESRIAQLVDPPGLELALHGVDGSGKTTLSDRIRETYEGTCERIYMGSSGFRTLPIRYWQSKRGAGLAMSLEQAYRRGLGKLLTRRGYLVIYDRHPWQTKVRGWRSVPVFALNYLHAGTKVHAACFLTGDVEKIHARKPEHTLEFLTDMNRRFSITSKIGSERLLTIDTTAHDADEVHRLVQDFIEQLWTRPPPPRFDRISRWLRRRARAT